MQRRSQRTYTKYMEWETRRNHLFASGYKNWGYKSTSDDHFQSYSWSQPQVVLVILCVILCIQAQLSQAGVICVIFTLLKRPNNTFYSTDKKQGKGKKATQHPPKLQLEILSSIHLS